jgi:DNA invertase Pin-like site-specific DNA recombinase
MPAKIDHIIDRLDSIRVAVYYRMSDDKQEGSIERQRAAVLAYCKKKGYIIVREYIDEGIPGDRLDRPAFQRLLADAQRGLFSLIVVDEPSRLSRSDPLTFLADIARPLRDAKVSVDSVSAGVQDWSDLANLILATVRADRSAAEVRDMSRRVLGGCMRALGLGRLPGGTPPYGYVAREGGYETDPITGRRRRIIWWETDPLRGEAVRYAFVRYDRGGITLEGLANELTARGFPPPDRKGSRRKAAPAWNWDSVKRILKRLVYTGVVVWGQRSQGKYNRITGAPGKADGGPREQANDPSVWLVRPGSHEALTSREVFDRIAQRLADHHRGGRGPHNLGRYVLSGLCRCGHCGRTLAGVPMNGQRLYRCRPKDHTGKVVCGCRAVEEGALLEKVVSALEAALLDEAVWDAALAQARKELEQASAPDRIETLRKRAAELEGQIAAGNRRLLQLPDDRLAGAVEALRELEGELSGLRQLEERLTQEKPVRDIEADLAACREWVGALAGAVPHRDNPEVAGALRGLLVAGVRSVEVHWRTEPFGRKNRYIPTGGVVELHGPNWRTLRQLNAW